MQAPPLTSRTSDGSPLTSWLTRSDKHDAISSIHLANVSLNSKLKYKTYKDAQYIYSTY